MNQIEARESNYNMFLEELLTQKIIVKHTPFELLIELTNLCNLNCAFCPYCGFCSKKIENVEMLNLETLKELSKFFYAAKFVNPSLRGEPFLYNKIEDFIHLCSENGLLDVMQLTNNGTQLHRFDLDKLKNLGVLAISFDSDKKDTFELLRHKSDYNQIIENIKYARNKLPNTHIKFCVCLNRYNLEDMVGIYKIARSLSVDSITFNGVYGDDRDKVIQLLRLRESDKIVVDRQMDQIESLNRDGKVEVANMITWYGYEDNVPLDINHIQSELTLLKEGLPYICFDDNLTKNNIDDLIKRDQHSRKSAPYKLPYCTSPFTMLAQLREGSISPCCSINFGKIDNINGKTAEEVWNGEGYSLLRKSMFHYDMLPDACKKCESFMRYTHIDQYLEYIEQKGIAISEIVIPPNYHPPLDIVKSKNLQKILSKPKTGGISMWLNNKEENNLINKEKHLQRNQSPKIATWDQVAQSYQLELDESDYKLANDISDILTNANIYPGATLIELGSGSGHISACLAIKGYHVTLFDFSEVALDKAKETFMYYQLEGTFIQGDLLQVNEIKEKYDIAWNSGVMEHFVDSDLEIAMLTAKQYAKKATLFLVPNSESISYLLMRARLMSEDKWGFGTEYLRNDYESHMKNIGLENIRKQYLYTPEISNYLMKTADTNADIGSERSLSELYKLLMNQKLFPEHEGYLVSFFATLSDSVTLVEKIDTDLGTTSVNTRIFDLNAEKHGWRMQHLSQKEEIDKLKQEINDHKECVMQLSSQQEAANEKLATEKEKEMEQNKEIAFIKSELQNEIIRINNLKMKKAELEESILQLSKQLELAQNNLEQQEKETQTKNSSISSLNKRLEQVEIDFTALEKEISMKDQIILQARNQCIGMTNSKMFKMVHLLNRSKYQGLRGSKIERKEFRHWFFSKIRKSGGDSDRRYNPLYAIIEKLDGKNTDANLSSTITNGKIILNSKANDLLTDHLLLESKSFEKYCKKSPTDEARKIQEIIRNRKTKGILIYPHVVHWEPLQTPQQILRNFACSGWLCFFCEHPKLPDIFREEETNLLIVHEADLLQAIAAEKVKPHILLTWMGSLSFTNCIESKTIWYHLLDKLDLFPYYSNSYLELHKQAILSSEVVSYVADPLLNCIEERADAVYLPNAVNPDEFLNLHENYIPEDFKAILNKNHKIIGYYGYLAEWMDYNLVIQLAEHRPNYEFVFIGNIITENAQKLEQHPNIHLLGFKKYSELADYAKHFDIGLIPFVIDEKMDCVSPIKFYEYCALGLPVITSKMPEVEKYSCDFITCADGKDEFLFYIDKYLSESIKQSAKAKAPLIAENNTWLSRVKKIQIEFDKELPTILTQSYNHYDILIFAVIDFDFRYQRPQHFAARFAENGHRVFYINANHHKESSIYKLNDNLYVINISNQKYSAIHLTDWSDHRVLLEKHMDEVLYQYGIRDAVTIVDYPNWVHIAEYLRSKYGFKIITDYMDDFTGFLNPAEDLVRKNCLELLKTSDIVLPSSSFLSDIAKKYNSCIEIVRNGTEFEHFNKASFKNMENSRKVVGYYGAVAHWFAFDIVCYVAEKLPDCDIVIIGEVTAGQEKLSRYDNIKLLGEIPYRNLPEYLTGFDVCLIPFDTSTDLIKATNPVKFYEYLSAGKKIVATEIPELIPYQNKFVYMSNDKDTFLHYITLCLTKSDCLAEKGQCIQFGKENDWQKRYELIAKNCVRSAPLVSIIVLTYNNLELNKKCIQSIVSRTAYPNYELIIVDNCSTDGTVNYLASLEEQKITNLKIIFNSTNLGFAGGNNVGMKKASGDYILLLNNDTLVTRGWLTALVKHMENNPQLGMCGPVTNSIGNEAKIKVKYQNRLEMELFSYEYTTDHLNVKYANPNVLALFCTIMRKNVIETCGYLDEIYDIGMFEDDDYAESVKKAGYQLEIAEDAFIHHYEGASFKKLEDERFQEIYNKNKMLFEEKWKKKWKMHEKREGITWDTNHDACADSNHE